jgi:gluconolactonase
MTQELLAPSAEVVLVGTGATWSEGPVWLAERGVVRWSDIPGNRILEVDPDTGVVTVYRDDVEFTNGRTLDLQGRVVQCSHGRRAVEREMADGIETLVERFEGRRFNSPNDVVVARDGAIWFTDPPYGILQAHEGHLGDPEYGGCHVFRLDPDGTLTAAITDIDEPNGLAFSPDESELYVTDTSAALRGGVGNHHIVAFRPGAGDRWDLDRVVYEVPDGLPDGLRVDVEGRIWTSGGAGVRVLTPTGEVLAHIPVPETVGNLCFGGPLGTTLFIAATTSIYRLETTTTDAAAASRKGGRR